MMRELQGGLLAGSKARTVPPQDSLGFLMGTSLLTFSFNSQKSTLSVDWISVSTCPHRNVFGTTRMSYTLPSLRKSSRSKRIEFSHQVVVSSHQTRLLITSLFTNFSGFVHVTCSKCACPCHL